MRLEIKLIKKLAEERTHRETEPSLEVRDEDHPFAQQRRWRNLSGGQPTLDALRDVASLTEPLGLSLADVGPLPGPVGGSFLLFFHISVAVRGGGGRSFCGCQRDAGGSGVRLRMMVSHVEGGGDGCSDLT